MGHQLTTKPKCGCGNTQNPHGYCDGTHLQESNETDETN